VVVVEVEVVEEVVEEVIPFDRTQRESSTPCWLLARKQ